MSLAVLPVRAVAFDVSGTLTLHLRPIRPGWALIAVTSVLSWQFGDGSTTDKLRRVLPALTVLSVASAATALQEDGQRVEVREADRGEAFAGIRVLAQDFAPWEMIAPANVAIEGGDRPRDKDEVRQAAEAAGGLALIQTLAGGPGTATAPAPIGQHSLPRAGQLQPLVAGPRGGVAGLAGQLRTEDERGTGA